VAGQAGWTGTPARRSFERRSRVAASHPSVSDNQPGMPACTSGGDAGAMDAGATDAGAMDAGAAPHGCQ